VESSALGKGEASVSVASSIAFVSDDRWQDQA
jgi:hypothetical protein